MCPLCQDPDIASPRPVENNGSNSSLQTEESEVLGNQVVSEEDEGSNNNSDNTSAENNSEDTTPWYRPTFLFPISNEQRESPGLSILEMSESERVSSRRGRQQRRRRRHRQSDELW